MNECDVVILAMKPQDFPAALEDLTPQFTENQIVISLAPGIPLKALKKMVPSGRIVRLMPNTPSLIGRGILGFMTEDQFDALTIACSSGTGFVFEMMMYWQDWIEERGFSPEIAKIMTIETFMGASMLAAQSGPIEIEELQSRVTSKKGVTAAGLASMRELEIERTLRISFEKAAMRSKELSRGTT